MLTKNKYLNSRKAGTQNDTPAKILKKRAGSTASILQKLFNETLRTGIFPNKLKFTNITQEKNTSFLVLYQ